MVMYRDECISFTCTNSIVSLPGTVCPCFLRAGIKYLYLKAKKIQNEKYRVNNALIFLFLGVGGPE